MSVAFVCWIIFQSFDRDNGCLDLVHGNREQIWIIEEFCQQLYSNFAAVNYRLGQYEVGDLSEICLIIAMDILIMNID